MFFNCPDHLKLTGVAQNMHQNKKSSERKVVGGREKEERERKRGVFVGRM